MVQIEIVFRGEAYAESWILWKNITQKLGEIYANKKVMDRFTGKQLGLTDVFEYLVKNKAESFLIEIDGGSIEFSYIADLDLSRLDINNLAIAKKCAEKWVSRVVNEPDFVQARLYDGEYDLWQNMEDIAYYESEGRDHSNLKKKSNGLPFPLEAQVIDISNNPGRWSLKHGFIECVGSTMWMSKRLLDDLGVNMDVSECVSDVGNAFKIEIQSDCFKNAVGEEAEAQNELRMFLFRAKEKLNPDIHSLKNGCPGLV